MSLLGSLVYLKSEDIAEQVGRSLELAGGQSHLQEVQVAV